NQEVCPRSRQGDLHRSAWKGAASNRSKRHRIRRGTCRNEHSCCINLDETTGATETTGIYRSSGCDQRPIAGVYDNRPSVATRQVRHCFNYSVAGKANSSASMVDYANGAGIGWTSGIEISICCDYSGDTIFGVCQPDAERCLAVNTDLNVAAGT